MGLGWFLSALMLLASAPAQINSPAGDPQTEATQSETLGFDRIRNDRMTVPVRIDGDGPYRFIIDTGSERTVISRELADRLLLDSSDDILLSSVLDVQQVPTVIIPALGLGRRTMENIQAPALARRDLGAHGMLGIDALEDHKVVLDFARREISLTRSRFSDRSTTDPNIIIVRARTRLGRLVLADVRIDGIRVSAIVDTGASFSIGNMALREQLMQRGRMDPAQSVFVTAVTGTSMNINYMIAEDVEIGRIALNELPIAFADSEMFRQLDLEDRPAMLLGMNALQAFDRVSIDFGNRALRLEFPSRTGPENHQFAAALRD